MTTRKKDTTASGAAAAGSGAVLGGAGLAGGGVPGLKAKGIWADVEQASGRRRKAAAATRAYRGGEFGYRHNAHHTFKTFGLSGKRKDNSPTAHYEHGVQAGKIASEDKIIPHLKVGRRVSNAALVGGAGLTAYGVQRARKKPISKADRDRQRKAVSGAALGAGGTLAVGAHAAGKTLQSQGRKWIDQGTADFKASRKIVPSANAVSRASRSDAYKAGELRGLAGQGRYFGSTYRTAGKYALKARGPALAVAGAGGVGLAAPKGKAEWQRRKKSVSKRRLMSDAELRRRKKLQGKISQTTSTLGLTGLGLTGAAALAAKKPGVLRQAQRVPGLKNATPEKMKNVAINTSLISGGIGGVGGYNFAAYTNAESRKRKPTVVGQPPSRVKKSEEDQMEMGYYGEEGHPVELPEITVPIEKAWSPVAGNFDSERSRQKRSKAYEGGALVGAGASGAYAGHHGMKAARELKPEKLAPLSPKNPNYALPSEAVHAIKLKSLKPAGKAAAGVAGVAAAAGAHRAVKRKRKSTWQPYAKRGVSAFGVDHLNPNGQHRETEN